LNHKFFKTFLPVFLILNLPILFFGFLTPVTFESYDPDFYFGISVAHANLSTIKETIDKTSPYTNVFVIGSTGITYDSEKLNETCQYIYDKELDFIIYTEKEYYSQIQHQWEEDPKNRWNTHFLGYYVADEPGGKQLDRSVMLVREAENFTDAAQQYENTFNMILRWLNYTENPSDTPIFTSDYALYWFDYKAGYDTVFAEFGWNYSRQLNIALNRGAATIQNKDWGVIITWTYNNPPYLESGPELYNDLVLAYENGAKYILIFDSNEDYTESTLKEEHFEAIEQFWQYTKDNPRESETEKRVAFVLPEGFGYGFRGPQDKIWGLWEADALSLEISYHLGTFLDKYGSKMDIIYDDELKIDETYSQYIFWNGTIISNQ
jgi:hypothetical protein